MTRNPEQKVDTTPRLNSSFDPLTLRELDGCDDGFRPWTWLVDPATTADERADHLRRFVRGHGTVDPTDRDLVLKARSRRTVISGCLRQHAFLDIPGDSGVRVRLSLLRASADPAGDPIASTRRAERHHLAVAGVVSGDADPASADGFPTPVGIESAAATPIRPGFPFAGPVALIGSTAPAGLAHLATGRHLAEEFADFLAGRGIRAMPAVATDPKHEWLDDLVVAEYPDEEASMVRTAAHTHLQPFLTVWRPDPAAPHGLLEVVGVANPVEGEVVARGAASLARVGSRPCPMIPGSGCGDLCRMHGGPWVSRSITAASRWESRRARMIRALGCDTCGDGEITVFAGKVRGGRRMSIPIRPDVATPTRHDRLVAASSE